MPAPGGRQREIDLLIGEPDATGKPDVSRARICIENKSVITAHRNRDARYDDLHETVQAIQGAHREAICGATVLIGVADRVLNIPDGVKKVAERFDFETRILPRLSTGDATLWDEFRYAISPNRPREPVKTVNKFRGLPTRSAGDVVNIGYDAIILVPVFIDNVGAPYLPRPNNLGIDVDAEYEALLNRLAAEYAARWP